MTAFAAFEAAVRSFAPRSAVIIGSGLGPVVDALPTHARIDFTDVPGFAAPTVHGHAGRVLLVEWGGVPVLAFRGRMHYYEGHSWDRCVKTVHLAADLGITTLLLTNAAGGLHPNLNPGDLMIIKDHLPLLDSNAWKKIANGMSETVGRVEALRNPPEYEGVRRVSKTQPALHVNGLCERSPYSSKLIELLTTISSLHIGVYAGLTGPTYETPAEIRALAALGVDAVGMSTVMEALAAKDRGLQVAAISCITNKAAGLSDTKLDHAEVADVAGRPDVVARLEGLLQLFLKTIS